jgi:fructokinase
MLSDPGPARSRLLALARYAHLVKASDEDLAWLFPGDPVETAARRLQELGVRLVVVTRGAAGSYAVTATAAVRLPARRVTVADTVGAGDAFTAGLLDALVDVGAATPATVGDLAEARLRAVLDRATVVAAVTCTRPGADPPYRDELPAVVSA